MPIRAGTDIAFLGAVIRHVIETESYFRDYVVHYTNASTIINDKFRDTEDLEGLFSGFDPATGMYDPRRGCTRAARSAQRPGCASTRPQAFSEHTGAGMLVGEVERDATLRAPAVRLPDPAPALRPLHAGDGPAHMRGLARGLHGGGGRADRQFRARAHEHVLLRNRLDTARRGRADDPLRRDPPVAARQRRPARRRHHGAAGARVDPGLDRHTHALRSAAGVPAHAARARGAPDAGGLPRQWPGRSRVVVLLRLLHHLAAEGLVWGGSDVGERLRLRAHPEAHRQPLAFLRRCCVRSTAAWKAFS